MDLCNRSGNAATSRTNPWAAAAAAGRALHRPPAGVSDEWLTAVVGGLASVAVPWELRDRPSRHHEGELVLATEEYEAWSLSWPPGMVGEWHDHATAGAVCVVSGRLREELVVAGQDEPRERVFGAGAGTVLHAGDRHRLANPGTTVLTSIHVYRRASGDVTGGGSGS